MTYEHGLVPAEVEQADHDRARDEAREREDVAVREVDQLQDAVDERVAERDERVDRARREADERDVEERLRGSSIRLPQQDERR